MGCFLGCFGFTTKKQKRLKNCNKFRVHQKYVPLDCEKANAADSELRDQPEEPSKPKVKKKVSFNLNVKTYERIQVEDDDNTTHLSEEEEKTQWEYHEQETAKASTSMYPSSHRYRNCNDEEDEIKLEESDIDDLDDEEDYGFSDDDDNDDDGADEKENNADEKENKFGNDKTSISKYPSSYRYYNCNDEEDEIKLEESDIDDLDDEEDYGFSDDDADNDDDGADGKENKFGNDKANEGGRDHRNGNSLLLPVESLTQWKAVKARGAEQVKQQKENIIKQEIPSIGKPLIDCADLNPKVYSETKPQGHNFPVDASLANWLVSAGAASVNGSTVFYIEDIAKKHQVGLNEVSINTI